MRRAGAVVLSAACLTALAACSAATKADVGPSVLPTRATSAAATPSPTAASPTPVASAAATTMTDVKDLSDPKLGIEFVDVPSLGGSKADVYNSLARYEVEYWRTLTTNKVSGGASEVFGADAVTSLKKIATQNTKNRSDIGGTFRSTITSITISDNGGHATATVCDNFDDATFKDPDGTYTPHEAGFDPTKKEITVVPGVVDGTWRIYEIKTVGTC